MKLVTYSDNGENNRIGALLGDETKVLDLQQAHCLENGSTNPTLSSMLTRRHLDQC